MSFSISGRTAIVTGAANGIGLAIARHFAAQGANVMLADKDEERLADEVGDNGEQGAGAMRYFAGDLRRKLTQANLISATVDAFERIDILVNAARQVLRSDPLALDDRSFEALLEQNLSTGFRLSQAVARRMIRQAGEGGGPDDEPVGSIINISSIAAHRVHPELLAYSVSTAALEQMTRALAVALAPQRIRVNAVAFGSVMSASLRDALAEGEAARADIIGHTPLGRIAAAGELAWPVQFLASEASGFITGQVLIVDGGRTLLDAVDTAAH